MWSKNDGIRFQGLRYVSPTLAGYVGRSVVIRYDPRDITEIRVFDHDEFVCKAVNQEHHDQKVSLKEIQAARNARRRALRAGINERIALVAAPTETPRITEAPAPAPRAHHRFVLRISRRRKDTLRAPLRTLREGS